MDYKLQILKIAEKNNGYITTKNVIGNNIPKPYLAQLINEKKIIKVSRGFYMLPNCFEDDYYRIQLTNSNAIFSLETALYLHDLSNRVPMKYYVTVLSNYGGNLLKNKNVELLYTKKEWLLLGVETINSPNELPIKVYDIDRTICDIIKNRNKVDPEIFGNAIKTYVHSKKKNITNLILYARKLNVEDEVRSILEIML